MNPPLTALACVEVGDFLADTFVKNLVDITITPEAMNTEHKLYSRLIENLLVKALEYKYSEPEQYQK